MFLLDHIISLAKEFQLLLKSIEYCFKNLKIKNKKDILNPKTISYRHLKLPLFFLSCNKAILPSCFGGY